MNKKNSLSAVVSVYNGENVLYDCLDSISFAEEIIVVNNSSTDKTAEIARKFTDKVFTRPNNPMLNISKNFGFSKATKNWILCLDADERVTPELQHEIRSIINRQDSEEINGYLIPRKNIIFGKFMEHTGWYPDHQLRFFKNGKGRFPERHVHEMVKVLGNIGLFKNDLVHYNYTSIFQFLQKMQIYAPNEAKNLLENGYKFTWQDAIRFPIKEFLSRFFARQGYKDGFHGLILSMLMAFYHLVVFSYIWEKMGFEKRESTNFIDEVKIEFKNSYKDMLFWIHSEKIKTTRNPFKKIIHRILKKVRVF